MSRTALRILFISQSPIYAIQYTRLSDVYFIIKRSYFSKQLIRIFEHCRPSSGFSPRILVHFNGDHINYKEPELMALYRVHDCIRNIMWKIFAHFTKYHFFVFYQFLTVFNTIDIQINV
eukprot:NODE_203_length_14950_cov_0.414450.p10 type:complete len:119 gc:universal NODE_203_length_14950_cov_0.414450:6393-6037(-)